MIRPIISSALAIAVSLACPAIFYGQALPTRLDPARVTSIAKVMTHIEQDGDDFKKAFNKALRSSTVAIEKRQELKSWIHSLEDSVDDLQEAYKDKDVKETHEKLVESLEIASGVNRFMLRADFGEANSAWARLRDDLNTLAGGYSQPVIPVLIIEQIRTRSR